MMKRRPSYLIILATLLLFSITTYGQQPDTTALDKKGRAYWKSLKTQQKAKFEEFKEWQSQYLNITDGKYSMMLSVGYGIPVINQRVEAPYPFLGSGILDVKADGKWVIVTPC